MKRLSVPKGNLRYSFNWSKIILGRFRKRHARATQVIAEIYNLDNEFWASLLATGNPLWQKLKDVVQDLERHLEDLPSVLTPEQVYSFTVDYLHRTGKERALEGLDRSQKSPTLSSRLFEG